MLVAPLGSPGSENSYAIHAHSLLSSTTLKTYLGHTAQVVSLDHSPIDDSFISGDASGVVRVWDARQPKIQCAGVLQLDQASPALVAYENNGSGVYVTDSATGMTYFYSLRKLGSGFERAIHVPNHVAKSQFVDLKLSPDSSRLLLTTDQDKILGLDANPTHRDMDESPEHQVLFTRDCVSTPAKPAQASFSGDGQYFCVNGPRGPLIFRSSNGEFVHELYVGEICMASQICCFSPTSELLITSDEDATVFWTGKR